MTREFVLLPEFDAMWKELDLNEDDLLRLQTELLDNPQVGDVMKGTGGVRKMRFALEHRGKSGSARIIYIDFAVYEKIYLLTAYAKKQKDNLSKEERNNMKKIVEVIEASLKNNRR